MASDAFCAWSARGVSFIISLVPVDRNSLPKDPEILQQMLVDLTSQLDKTQRLLTQLLAAKSGTRSEQLSADQLRLFTQELGAELHNAAPEAEKDSTLDDDLPPGSGSGNGNGDENPARPRGRRSLPAHLKRERIEHDLREEQKTAPPATRTCARWAKRPASATSTSPPSCG